LVMIDRSAGLVPGPPGSRTSCFLCSSATYT
jgi:hypothetical protein